MEIPTRPSGRHQVYFAIICQEDAADAVLLLRDHFYDDDSLDLGKVPGDPNMYTVCTMGRHNIVVVKLPEKGSTAATAAAATLRISYPGLRMAIVVGVCGGIPSWGPNATHLGDAVIGKGVVQYDNGRQYDDCFVVREAMDEVHGRPGREIRSLLAFIETNHHRKRLLMRAAAHLRRLQEKAIAENFETKFEEPPKGSDWCYPAEFLHKHHVVSGPGECGECSSADDAICQRAADASCEECGCSVSFVGSEGFWGAKSTPSQPLKVILGLIGSANMSMKSAIHRDRLANAHKIVAFDMETAGVWDEIPSLAIKGICNYADGHGSKGWQSFAAARAAAVARAVIESLHLYDPLQHQSTAAAPKPQLSTQGLGVSDGHQPVVSRTMTNITIGNGSFVNQGDIWFFSGGDGSFYTSNSK